MPRGHLVALRTRAGSQQEVAERLGVSRSLIGGILTGERSGERYRDAAKARHPGSRRTFTG